MGKSAATGELKSALADVEIGRNDLGASLEIGSGASSPWATCLIVVAVLHSRTWLDVEGGRPPNLELGRA